MKSKYLVFFVMVIFALIFIGCPEEPVEFEDYVEETIGPKVGTADFTRFVTIGNSFTAGYQNSSLYKSAQDYSYGNLLAKKLNTQYEFPSVSDPGTGGRIELVSFDSSAVITRINVNTGSFTNSNLPRPYNNLGIPGAYLYDVVNATSSSNCALALSGGGNNPFFDAILRGQGSAYRQVKSLTPTMIIVWIGVVDLYGYTTSGGVSSQTPVSVFHALYNQLADSLSAMGVKVIAINIPDFKKMPYFTSIGDALQRAGTQRLWARGSAGDTLLMSLSNNLLTLNASSEFYDANGNPTGKGFSRSLPLSNFAVLDSGEISIANQTLSYFNQSILTISNSKGWGHVDINSLFSSIEHNASQNKFGINVNGIQFSSLFYSGKFYSLDGIHPTNLGHALIANEIIKVINSKYSAQVKPINVAAIPWGIPNAKIGKYSNSFIPIIPKDILKGLFY